MHTRYWMCVESTKGYTRGMDSSHEGGVVNAQITEAL